MKDDELTRLAVRATLHCLTGCAVGEILGTVIGSGLGWNNLLTALLGITLAFIFGYGLTMRPLLRDGLALAAVAKLALASDTLSITTMEVMDTLIVLLVPGALMAGPTTLLFWSSLGLSLIVAFVCAVPVNRYLIARGRGHALVHAHHH